MNLHNPALIRIVKEKKSEYDKQTSEYLKLEQEKHALAEKLKKIRSNHRNYPSVKGKGALKTNSFS